MLRVYCFTFMIIQSLFRGKDTNYLKTKNSHFNGSYFECGIWRKFIKYILFDKQYQILCLLLRAI